MTAMNGNTLLCIGLAALATYWLRAGGLLLAERFKDTGRLKRFMDALPGTILLSLVAPGILAAGIWGAIAALGIVICVRRTGNIFLSMMVGIAIIAAQRQLF